MVKLNDKQSHSHRQKNGARGLFDIELLLKNKKKGGGITKLVYEQEDSLGCVRIRTYLMEFFDNCLSKFAAFTAFASNTELRTQVIHITRTITTKIANLVIGNLSANTHVHG